MSAKAGTLDLQPNCADVEQGYHTQLDALLAQVAELETRDNAAARAVRAAQVKHLADLVARKSAIEAEILGHAQELAAAYDRVRAEVGGVVAARLAGLEESVGGLEGLKADADGGAEEGAEERVGQGEEERREGDVQMALDGVVEGVGGGEVGRGTKRKRGEEMEGR